jgi:glucose-6-phosphate 1-dehydrogenase
MSHTIVIFGASGDLTSRKLIPALYELHRKNRLPDGVRIVGVSRTPFSHEQWRAKLAETMAEQQGAAFETAVWRTFAGSLYYQPGDIGKSEDFDSLRTALEQLEAGRESTRIYYLSMAPRFYEAVIAQLGAAELADQSCERCRIVIEKPFGTDQATARRLNEKVHEVFHEPQVYRIDHYLGKETVSNVLVLRFANTIFEPVWNRNYIDHVQITAAEDLLVGRRAGYYDSAGILRDMFQNHLLQLLTLTAMETPSHFEANAVRDEKVKVLQAIRPMQADEVEARTLRGQYDGYRNEPGVAADSRTATFGVASLAIDNWRWQGVPFYLRSGKAMSCRTTQIVIQFRQPPHMMFDRGPKDLHEANRLVLQIQPAEGIQLHFQTKVPDAEMLLRQTELDFNFQRQFRGEMPEAYERLLLDVLQGDASLFARADEVELAWGIIDPIQQAWDAGRPELAMYEQAGWGPSNSTAWMQRDQRQWFDLCPVLH